MAAPQQAIKLLLGLARHQGRQGHLLQPDPFGSPASKVQSSLLTCLKTSLATGGQVERGAPSLFRQAHALATAGRRSATGRSVSLLTNLKQLSKFKLSSLVVLTASAGYVAGSGDSISWSGLMWTSLGTFGAAACANTLNQVYEVANDRLMSRTCNRPLPAGRMTRLQALAFAAASGLFGLGVLHHYTNDTTTLLGAANIFLYAGVYTPLKQMSIANTWVGAVVGAIPPLMGWASAAGQLEPGSLVLAAGLFFWQLPHFLALAWLCKDDYLAGGFKMMSGVDATGRRTALAALRNSIYLLPLGLAAYYTGVTSQPFAWEAAALSAMLCVPAIQFVRHPSQQASRKLFKSSLLYLPLMMLGMAVHRQPNDHTVTLGQLQAQLWEQVEATSLHHVMRVGVERSVLGAARVLGLHQYSMAELKCPSTVHGDDGRGARVASRDRLTDEELTDEELAALAYQQRTHSMPLPVAGMLLPLHLPHRASGLKASDRSSTDWEPLVNPGGSWKGGVRAH